MQIFNSIIAAALLSGMIYAVIQGFIIAGLPGAVIVLIFLVLFMGVVKAIYDTVAAPFRNRRNG